MYIWWIILMIWSHIYVWTIPDKSSQNVAETCKHFTFIISLIWQPKHLHNSLDFSFPIFSRDPRIIPATNRRLPLDSILSMWAGRIVVPTVEKDRRTHGCKNGRPEGRMSAEGHTVPLLLGLLGFREAVISLFLHSFHQQTAPDPLMFTHQMTHGHTHTHTNYRCRQWARCCEAIVSHEASLDVLCNIFQTPSCCLITTYFLHFGDVALKMQNLAFFCLFYIWFDWILFENIKPKQLLQAHQGHFFQLILE